MQAAASWWITFSPTCTAALAIHPSFGDSVDRNIHFLHHIPFDRGVPYPLLLAGAAAALEFIPAVGPFVGGVIIMVVAATGGYPHLLWIVAFLVIYRIFQDYVLNPYLLSSSIEVHPMLVLFGVLAGEQLAGIPGCSSRCRRWRRCV